MRQKRVFIPRQHTLPFARQEVWRSIPSEHQRRCRELCEQLLRVVLQAEEQRLREEEP